MEERKIEERKALIIEDINRMMAETNDIDLLALIALILLKSEGVEQDA